MKSIDKQGTDWLKSKPQEKSSSSWWTKLRATTRDRVSKLNRRMTRHSREVTQRNAQRSQQFVSSLPDVRNMDVHPGTFSVSWNLLGLLLLIVLGMLYVFHWRKGAPGQEAVVSEFVFPRSIHDSESLLMAFHALGQQLGGWQSQFWHHRRLIQRLSGDRSTESDTLAQLYEKARYEPNCVLSSQEVDEARRILSQLQQRLHAS